ncbi:Polysaccharide deacetylase-like protein [Sulfitobacter noctilucicola]|uniref:Polysaccharide deacetylase n=1 Tax=Sulfitobacter noctilucicola TaxID=1342301 RepID=A0A7W6M9R8_9RHOB|nr:polysaccharide deacetylase family protein [Sulfitobacter noctilucicola]KIN63422.1 Polysaccharide deacetylase-like protein [Sulfitobacter noctilucicola]MBB4175065.1 hypothetical protein [Sulfitobacter noctilucicola]
MKVDWQPLEQEFQRWRQQNLSLKLWWRDDDAVTQTKELDRLTRLSDASGLPVHLAVIPKFADASLVRHCAEHSEIIPIVHGWAHANHAPADQKKAEFGHQRADLINDAERGIVRLRGLFGDDLLPVFTPPWNRVDAGLLPQLAGLGYKALSTFTPRRAPLAARGLAQINTHIDPIHWKAGGGLVEPDDIVAVVTANLTARRKGKTDNDEPLGILTHHLVHDEAIWAFTESLIKTLLDGGADAVDLRKSGAILP